MHSMHEDRKLPFLQSLPPFLSIECSLHAYINTVSVSLYVYIRGPVYACVSTAEVSKSLKASFKPAAEVVNIFVLKG